MLRKTILVLPAIAIAIAACAGETPTDSSINTHPDMERGKIGKADLWGSCEELDIRYCGGPSFGTCWCDDECELWGDCCEDYSEICVDDPDPDCLDPNDPDVKYAGHSPAQCAAMFFICDPGWDYFFNDCGCGCTKAPVLATCSDIDDAETCNATAGCGYYFPGCGTPALPGFGCYETCADDVCDGGGSCTAVWINPCAGSPCQACGAEVSLCI